MAESKRSPSELPESSEQAGVTATSAVTPPLEEVQKKDAPPPKSAASNLSPEEQMALYEADLKENDWGHQPC